jgi:hypothetical protein
MSEGAHAAADHGHMDIHDQKDTFHHFVLFALWGTLLVIMTVALLTVGLAMGLGWFAGLAVYFVIGAGAGLGIRMGAAWWATLLASTVLLGLGGLVVALVM